MTVSSSGGSSSCPSFNRAYGKPDLSTQNGMAGMREIELNAMLHALRVGIGFDQVRDAHNMLLQTSVTSQNLLRR